MSNELIFFCADVLVTFGTAKNPHFWDWGSHRWSWCFKPRDEMGKDLAMCLEQYGWPVSTRQQQLTQQTSCNGTNGFAFSTFSIF